MRVRRKCAMTCGKDTLRLIGFERRFCGKRKLRHSDEWGKSAFFFHSTPSCTGLGVNRCLADITMWTQDVTDATYITDVIGYNGNFESDGKYLWCIFGNLWWEFCRRFFEFIVCGN